MDQTHPPTAVGSNDLLGLNEERYTMLLDAGAVRAVESIRTARGLKTKADVYELAVRVLAWALEQRANGYEVGRYKDDEFQPLLMD